MFLTKKKYKKLETANKNDLDEIIWVEIIHFVEFRKLYLKSTEMNNAHFTSMYKTLIEKDHQEVFLKVEVVYYDCSS